MKKRVFLPSFRFRVLFLSFLLALSVAAAPALAVSSGYCNTANSIAWTLYDSGQMSIRGSGMMTDWNTRNQTPWYASRNRIRSLTAEEGVMSIGANAFSTCAYLSDAELPAGLRYIGDYAFSGTALSEIIIPPGVTFIGKNAFASCDSLYDVSLPHSVTEIGQYAFSGCNQLRSFSASGSLLLISPGTFQDCALLRDVSLPESVEEIGQRAFSGCKSLERLTIPKNVETIRDYAISGCSALTDIYYPGTQAQWDTINQEYNRENVSRPLTQFRQQIQDQGITVHFNESAPDSPDKPDIPDIPDSPDKPAAITAITVEGNAVTVDLSAAPEAGSTLTLAAYGADGRFLGMKATAADVSSWYTFSGLDLTAGGSVAAFLTDAAGNPAAACLKQKL